VRDIEAAFTDTSGNSLLSKSAVSHITERLWADYQAFADRDLSEYGVVYLFIDGLAERLHLGQPREAVLAAWGITDRGEKVLLGLSPGTKEDTASARDLLRDLKARNLSDPLLVISDAAPGLIRAIEEVFPKSLRQRCLAHRMRNLQGKVPEERWREVKAQAQAAYTAASPMLARLTKEEFVKRLRARAAERDVMLSGRLRSVHRASASAHRPSPCDSYNQFAREVVRRRAPAYQSDSACVRRAAGAQTDVRGVDPCKPNLAPNRDQRIRVETDRGTTQRTRERSYEPGGRGFESCRARQISKA
jgi:hypothetical protein